jgi:hypothetical protein
MLVQGIPRSYKLDSQLSYVDVPLCSLEKAAVQVGDQVAKVPDLLALEELVDRGWVGRLILIFRCTALIAMVANPMVEGASLGMARGQPLR